MRRLLGAALLCACQGPTPVIVIDTIANCEAASVETLASDLFPDAAVLGLAADGPDLDSGWVLVDEVGPNAVPRLAVRRTPADNATIELDAPSSDAAKMSIVPGTRAREVFVLRRNQASITLWRIESDDGIVARAQHSPSSFATLPLDAHLELLIIAGTPHLLGIPRSSDEPKLDLRLGRLGPDLELIDIWKLTFELGCVDTGDEQALQHCLAQISSVSYPEIELIAAQPDPRRDRATLGIRRLRADGPLLYASEQEILALTLVTDQAGRPTGSLRGFGFDDDVAIVPPAEVAVDEYASYIRFQTNPGGHQLARFSQSETSILLGSSLDSEGFTLLQLADDIAVGELTNGSWVVIKVFPDDVSKSTVTYHEVLGTVFEAVEPAGPGHFMLRKQSGAPDHVAVRCAER